MLFGYEFNRYAIEGSYRNYIIDYDRARDAWQTRMDHIYGIALFYKLTAKTALFGQYRLTSAEYGEQNDGIDMTQFGSTGTWNATNSQDYTQNNYFIGARFTPGGKLSGEAKIGWGDMGFDNTADKDGVVYADQDTWVAESSVSYQASSQTLLTLNLQRAQLTSSDSDGTSIIDTVIGIALRQQLTRRLVLTAGLAFHDQDYQNEPAGNAAKNFDEWTWDTGLMFPIKEWLHTGIDYRYKSKSASNTQYAGSEYTINSIAWWIAALF